MNRRTTACVSVLLFGLGALAPSSAGAAPGDEEARFQFVSFELERKGFSVPHWKIAAGEDGQGTYTEIPSSGAAGESQPIRIDAGTRRRLTAAIAIVKDGRCETKSKNIANTGQKTLSYRLENVATPASCTFNFSDNDTLNSAADALLAIAETMQAGERLAQKHRYDHLGLDAEIDALVAEVKIGHATNIVNIAPVLQSIADDERLMERVQRKAARLLQDASSSDATASAR